MRFLSIRVKLMILALIILVPLVTLQLFNIGKNVRRSTDQKLEASAEFAYAISKVFYKYIKELWIQESIIGEYISSNIDDIDEIQSYLDKIVRNDDNNI